MDKFGMAELALKSVCPTNCMKYDDQGMPSIMVYIPKFRLCDVLSTDDASIHPAFIVNGVEIDGFYVGKFETCHYNDRAYSWPLETPTYALGLDIHVACNRAKGGNFHEITAAEWAAIALWCHKNGCEPKGNNNQGKDTSEKTGVSILSESINYMEIPAEVGNYDIVDGLSKTIPAGYNHTIVLTGSGPVTWSHDGTIDGIWDMNGNMQEWCAGMRLFRGEIQVIPDNNAADPTIDISENSAAWKAINATDGSLITPDGNGTTVGAVKLQYSDGKWGYTVNTPSLVGDVSGLFADITADATIGHKAKLLLMSLAILPDHDLTGDGIDNSYGGAEFWCCVTEGETCAKRGGARANLTGSGLFFFATEGRNSHSYGSTSGRSAFFD